MHMLAMQLWLAAPSVQSILLPCLLARKLTIVNIMLISGL